MRSAAAVAQTVATGRRLPGRRTTARSSVSPRQLDASQGPDKRPNACTAGWLAPRKFARARP